MTDQDWDFCIGNLGDPLQDIEWWMTPPHPDWVEEERERSIDGTTQCGEGETIPRMGNIP